MFARLVRYYLLVESELAFFVFSMYYKYYKCQSGRKFLRGLMYNMHELKIVLKNFIKVNLTDQHEFQSCFIKLYHLQQSNVLI